MGYLVSMPDAIATETRAKTAAAAAALEAMKAADARNTGPVVTDHETLCGGERVLLYLGEQRVTLTLPQADDLLAALAATIASARATVDRDLAVEEETRWRADFEEACARG